MRIIILIPQGDFSKGQLVDAAVYSGGQAAAYDRKGNLYQFFGTDQFEIYSEAAPALPEQKHMGLPLIFGQELKRLEVEFK